MGFKIIGSADAVPSLKVTNEDLSQIVDTSDEWIVSRTGISSRYISETETTSDLGARAALEAIKQAKIDPQEIGMLICATSTPDQPIPSTASLIQKKLGFNSDKMMCFDMNAACTGFIYALQIAASMVNRYRYILIIGAETMSRLMDWTDRNTCVLFGDGAGAWLIEKDDNMSFEYHYARSAVDVDRVLYVEGKGNVKDFAPSDQQQGYLEMKGKEVFRFATNSMIEAIVDLCQQAEVDLKEVDWIVPHQANVRIISLVSKKLMFPMERFIMNLDQFGNTSAASVAMAYAQAQQQGKIKPKEKILFIGFGAGLSVGATLVQG